MPSGTLRPFRTLAAVAAASLLGLGCARQKQQTAVEFMPDMAYGPRVAAQSEDPMTPGVSVMRVPVPGTVPRGYTPYRFAQADTTAAERTLVNPLPRTAAVLARGQKVYMTYCVVCHGETGDGQGYIVPKFPQPPQLFSPKVTNWVDGRIFHVITRGQNLMPSYAAQILPEDRWAVIHYVRVLQRAAHPTPQDLAGTASPDDSAGAAPAAGTTPVTPAAAGGH
jgi:mono/diheme cytochrome c family protein